MKVQQGKDPGGVGDPDPPFGATCIAGRFFAGQPWPCDSARRSRRTVGFRPNITCDLEALFQDACLMLAELSLHLKKLCMADPERLLESGRHLRGKRGFSVQQIGQRREADAQQLSRLYRQTGSQDLSLDVEAGVKRLRLV